MKGIDVRKSKRKSPFDPEVFLGTEDGGRAIFKYKKGHALFVQGGPADAVFYIRNGKIKITVVSEQGKEAVVAILGPDEFCGEGCLTGQVRRPATAAAMTECEIMRLEKATMIRVIHDEGSSLTGKFWQRRSTRTGHREGQPRDACGDDRYHAISRELLHEQISEIGPH
jgi:CRP-like cAMP-binding protein